MKEYLDHLIESPLYFIIVLAAFLAGGAVYLFSQRKNRTKKAALFLITSALSLLLSTAVCMMVSKAFSAKIVGYRSFFSLFYYIISFFLITAVIEKSVMKDFSATDMVKPLLLTISISRIACAVEGCCSGALPFSFIESLLAFLTLLYSSIFKAPSPPWFLTGYGVYRFTVEFFKDVYLNESLGALTVMQYISILTVIVCAIIIIIKDKGEKQREK